MSEYNGYKSYSRWNQVLWLSNDCGLEEIMRELTDKGYSKVKKTNVIWNYVEGEKTGDGVKYTKSAVKHWVSARG